VLKDHWRWVQSTRTEAYDFIRQFIREPFVPEAEWQPLDDIAPAWEDFCGRVRDGKSRFVASQGIGVFLTQMFKH